MFNHMKFFHMLYCVCNTYDHSLFFNFLLLCKNVAKPRLYFQLWFNGKISTFHEHCLQIIYHKKQSSFEELLQKDNSVSIQHINLQSLANVLYTIFMQELIMPNKEHPCNLRHLHQFTKSSVNTVYHSTKRKYFLEPMIWEVLPDSFKKMKSVEDFKRAIKIWKQENCLCRLCRVYV